MLFRSVKEDDVNLFSSMVNLESDNLEDEIERVASEYNAQLQRTVNRLIAEGNYSPANGLAGDDESFIKQMEKWGDSLTEKK